jgi:hypothetical protein
MFTCNGYDATDSADRLVPSAFERRDPHRRDLSRERPPQVWISDEAVRHVNPAGPTIVVDRPEPTILVLWRSARRVMRLEGAGDREKSAAAKRPFVED